VGIVVVLPLTQFARCAPWLGSGVRRLEDVVRRRGGEEEEDR